MKKIPLLTKTTLLLLTMMTMMSNVAVVTMLPLLKDIFRVENIELLSRLMITLPSLSIAILAPFLGHFVTNIGKKKSAIIGLIIFSITGSAGLYLDGIYLILFSRFLFGIAIAILMIVSTSLVGDYFQNEARHKFMGIQSAFMSLGGIFFIVGGGILSDISWRYPFAIYLIGILILFFAFKYIVEVHTPKKTDEEFTSSNLYSIYFLAFLLMVIFYILPTQIPFLIINVFNASGLMTGEIISIAFIFNALGAISFAPLKKRFLFPTIYMFGLIIIGIGFIIIGYIENINLFFLTSSMMGFGGGILMTTVTAWLLHKAHHSKRVKSTGYLTSSLFLGQFFSPIITYPLVKFFGIQDFFKVIGGVILFSILIVFLYKSIKK